MGCKVTTPFRYNITKALKLKRGQASNSVEKKTYDDALKKAEKGYQRYAKMFEQLNKGD